MTTLLNNQNPAVPANRSEFEVRPIDVTGIQCVTRVQNKKQVSAVPTYLFTYILTYFVAYLFTYFLTYSFSYLITFLLIYSLT
jgi:hypothetical protein